MKPVEGSGAGRKTPTGDHRSQLSFSKSTFQKVNPSTNEKEKIFFFKPRKSLFSRSQLIRWKRPVKNRLHRETRRGRANARQPKPATHRSAQAAAVTLQPGQDGYGANTAPGESVHTRPKNQGTQEADHRAKARRKVRSPFSSQRQRSAPGGQPPFLANQKPANHRSSSTTSTATAPRIFARGQTRVGAQTESPIELTSPW